jgi:hypothetical protein
MSIVPFLRLWKRLTLQRRILQSPSDLLRASPGYGIRGRAKYTMTVLTLAERILMPVKLTLFTFIPTE